MVTVSGIDLNLSKGSIVVLLFWKDEFVGREAFLTRWNRKYCGNCQKKPQLKTAAFNVNYCAEKNNQLSLKKEEFNFKVSWLEPETSEFKVTDVAMGQKGGPEMKVHRVWTPEVE